MQLDHVSQSVCRGTVFRSQGVQCLAQEEEVGMVLVDDLLALVEVPVIPKTLLTLDP
jgi:hypothetical protein